ncbi:MAG: UDP-3-O-(3-hydroxymyristoyl)glucosamine N-acyltransferase [Pseudomonadota bacterium]|nr:UDP-3-O-(3-hydroxymyristoyl)glucosamine N-acyltransferase [Pseudomonadota bacterium]
MPTLGDIAKALDLPFRGNPETSLSRLASLDSAGGADLSFVAQKKFSKQLSTSTVGAVICPEDWVGDYRGAVIFSAQPYVDFARATRLFDNRPQPSGRVHETAVVATTAQMGANVTIDCGAVLEDGVVLGDNVWIGPNVWLGSNVTIGNATELRCGVSLYHGVTLGHECLIHANTVIGSDGFGFAPTDSGWEKIIQLGTVTIGDRVEIGAGCAIDRGALDNTVIKNDVIIDNLVHIAHGVIIGDRSAIAGQVGFAGGAKLGERCTVGGQAGFAGHLEIANGVHIGGQGRVSRSITESGHYASGTGLMPTREWARNAARFEKLNDMAKRIKALEKALAEKVESNS